MATKNKADTIIELPDELARLSSKRKKSKRWLKHKLACYHFKRKASWNELQKIIASHPDYYYNYMLTIFQLSSIDRQWENFLKVCKQIDELA